MPGNRKLVKAGASRAKAAPADPLFPSAPRNFRIGNDVLVCDEYKLCAAAVQLRSACLGCVVCTALKGSGHGKRRGARAEAAPACPLAS